MILKIRLYNTMGRQLQEFSPIDSQRVKMYACGPTVYNYAHIGNLRTYVFEDVLRRLFEYVGYSVEHVMNVTDVGHLTDDADEGEDKMEKSSRESGKSVWEIAGFYTDAFFKDTDRLNIVRPTMAPRATKHIGDMIELIRRLEAGGHTYEAGGNIYFSIDTFPEYGKMALLDRQELQAGARIDVDSNKRNPHDFVLWFTNSKFENHAMQWDSPWGKGYPGWHIECSAMSIRYLGEQFDIHCGGIDHVPVHHTNEIAQAEAATGKTWVRYWVHGEFLIMNKGKMAKSAGNFLTLQSLIDEGFSPMDYRYFCLGGHYRSQLQFSFESLNSAKSARERLMQRIEDLWEQSSRDFDSLPQAPEGTALEILQGFEEAVSQDMNMPKALAELWKIVKSNESAEQKLSVLREMDRILGLQLLSRENSHKDDDTDREKVEALLEERGQARKEKNFARADEIRDTLKEMGIEIKDTPEGTKWSRSL